MAEPSEGPSAFPGRGGQAEARRLVGVPGARQGTGREELPPEGAGRAIAPGEDPDGSPPPGQRASPGRANSAPVRHRLGPPQADPRGSPGPDSEAGLLEDPALPPGNLEAAIRGFGDALGRLHAGGISHGDLASSNVLYPQGPHGPPAFLDLSIGTEPGRGRARDRPAPRGGGLEGPSRERGLSRAGLPGGVHGGKPERGGGRPQAGEGNPRSGPVPPNDSLGVPNPAEDRRRGSRAVPRSGPSRAVTAPRPPAARMPASPTQ